MQSVLEKRIKYQIRKRDESKYQPVMLLAFKEAFKQ